MKKPFKSPFSPGYVNPALYHPLGGLPGVEDVLQGGHVVSVGHPLEAVQEVLDRVCQLILVTPVKRLLDTFVRPQLVQHRLKTGVRNGDDMISMYLELRECGVVEARCAVK